MAELAQELKPITVHIAGRPYPLRVAEREEADLRELVGEINEKFNDFQIKFSNKDKQDCLVMTLLTFASELSQARRAAADATDEELTKRLGVLEGLIDRML